MNIEEAFSLFCSLAESAKLHALASHPEDSPDIRQSVVQQSGGQLRLIWQPGTRSLRLDISHGPSELRTTFWQELYAAHCPEGHLPNANEEEVSFQSSVEYGLELLSPLSSTLAPGGKP